VRKKNTRPKQPTPRPPMPRHSCWTLPPNVSRIKTMRKPLKIFAVATLIAASVAVATAAFAAMPGDNDPGAGQTAQMMQGQSHMGGGMMQGQGHMGQGMMGNAPMPMMQMMTGMNQMMRNCNQMMEIMMNKSGSHTGSANNV